METTALDVNSLVSPFVEMGAVFVLLLADNVYQRYKNHIMEKRNKELADRFVKVSTDSAVAHEKNAAALLEVSRTIDRRL